MVHWPFSISSHNLVTHGTFPPGGNMGRGETRDRTVCGEALQNLSNFTCLTLGCLNLKLGMAPRFMTTAPGSESVRENDRKGG